MCVRDLQPLAFRLLEILVVRDFEHDGGDDLPEAHAEFVGGGVGVLDRVVQQRRAENGDVVDPLALQHAGQRDRMIDVGRGLGILAPLVAVLVRRERDGFQQQGLRVGVHGRSAQLYRR